MTAHRKAIVIGLCLLAGGVLVAGIASAHGNQTAVLEVQAMFRPIDTEARYYLTNAKEPTSQELEDLAARLKNKYTGVLDSILSAVETTSGQRLAEKSERENLKYLIVREHLHEIQREQEQTKPSGRLLSHQTVTPVLVGAYPKGNSTVTVYGVGVNGDNPYPINYWVQVSPDVNGGSGTDGSGASYSVNGNNQFYQLDIATGSNYVKYTLYYKDEDHPNSVLDALYDAWRQLYYGRVYDIESFEIKSGVMYFSDIWDEGRTYANSVGVHGTQTRAYRSGVVVYISNVWNHAMDTADTNSSMSKIGWRTD